MTHYLSVADDGLLCPAAVVAELQTRPANRFAWARYDCAAPFLRIHSGFLGLSRDVAEVLVESQTLEFEAMFWALRLTVLDDSYRILPASLSRVALENEQERNFCKSRIWAGSLDTLSAGGGRPRGFLGAAPARPATTTTPRTAGAYAVGAGRTIMPARNAYGQRTGGQFAPKTPAAVEWQGATAKQNLGAVPPAWANAAPSTGFNGAAPRTGVKAVCNGGKMCIQKSTGAWTTCPKSSTLTPQSAGPPFCWASRRCKETARSAAEAASGAEAAPGAVGGRRLLAAEVDDDRATPRRFAREGPADAPRARPARDGGRRTGTADDDDDGAGEDRQPKRTTTTTARARTGSRSGGGEGGGATTPRRTTTTSAGAGGARDDGGSATTAATTTKATTRRTRSATLGRGRSAPRRPSPTETGSGLTEARRCRGPLSRGAPSRRGPTGPRAPPTRSARRPSLLSSRRRRGRVGRRAARRRRPWRRPRRRRDRCLRSSARPRSSRLYYLRRRRGSGRPPRRRR
ncbi:hypothetical protein M885DRAFT_329481 [Pelagophyceae sp. CCMP2097]|nr:hypothetical protein M885DRAFT_329481 [Pelagophyceae sp. CCMP2097]